MMPLDDAQLAEVMAHSYKDFHAKGLHYICLKRSLTLTEKIYFFEGDVRHLPEVVHPHDHRYDFRTDVLAGMVTNSLFVEHEAGEVFQRFAYRTPLNGGSGFRWLRETRLLRTRESAYGPGASYMMPFDRFHTLRVVRDGTVLRLRQYRDRIPIGQPTATFTRSKEPPSLDGLYGKFTADEILVRLSSIASLILRAAA